MAVPPRLQIRTVAGHFNSLITLRSIDLALGPKAFRKLLKRGNTNGDALIGYVVKFCAPASKRV